jgi:apolipoprotein N-acyltransferase
MNEYLEKKDNYNFKILSDSLINGLINETIKQSNAGAKIVVWSEISSKILKSDEDSLVAVFKNLAKKQNIYLSTTPYIIAPNSSLEFSQNDTEKSTKSKLKSENKTFLFSPSGDLILTHYKFGGNFMEGTIQGDKIIKAVNTEFGKLSAII